jgi:hypothetical protein
MTETALAVRGAASVPADQAKALADRLLNNKGLFADDMTERQALQIAMIAVAYGLDPIAGEVVPYEGKPLITLDGRIRVCADHPEYDGIEYTRVANADERRAFRLKPEEDMWVAAAWRKGVRFPSVGYGRAGGAYERNALVIGSKRTGYNPGRGPELARKRAIVNALKMLFPMPRPKLPGLEDELGLPVWEDSAPEQARAVDRATGEIVEGEARELPPGSTVITKEQTAAIHAAAKSAGYDDRGYRFRLREMFGVDSSLTLDAGQAQAAIAAFGAEAAEQNDTAEERVAARRGAAGDLEEQAFYATLDERAAATGAEEPRFFRRSHATSTPDRGGSAAAPAPDAPAPPAAPGVGAEPPTNRALDAYATALSRAAALGLDLAHYEINASTITAAELGALHDNLLVAIEAAEPEHRLAGM